MDNKEESRNPSVYSRYLTAASSSNNSLGTAAHVLTGLTVNRNNIRRSDAYLRTDQSSSCVHTLQSLLLLVSTLPDINISVLRSVEQESKRSNL